MPATLALPAPKAMTILLDALLRDSAYQLDHFSQAQIDALQAAIRPPAHRCAGA